MENKKYYGWKGFFPLLTFLAIYLGSGLICAALGYGGDSFKQVPRMAALVGALLVCMCMGGKERSLEYRMDTFCKGMSNQGTMIMIMVFLLAGAFSGVAKAMGGVQATANLGLSLVPTQFMFAGLFLISAFMATAMGTSMGTISAVGPIAVAVAESAGLNLALAISTVLGGAMFGDNLSMISDTTIAATRTQGVALKDKFRVNFYIALPAALITLVILLLIGRGSAAVMEPRAFELVKVLPYVLVLMLAIVGINVFLTLTIGIFTAGIIGIIYGDLTIFTFAQAIWNGFTGMSEVFFLALFCGGISELIAHNGGIVWLIEKLRKRMHGGRSAQMGIAALVSLADFATANNTVAIILCGSVAKDMSREFKVDPRRTASLLDVFSCVFQGIIPYGAQLLMAASLTTTTYQITISPVEIVPYMWYCWILAAFGLLSIFVPYADSVCRKDPWNWEADATASCAAAGKPMPEQKD